MRERVQCEFFLIRYVPDVVKGEFTNIGVVLRQAAAPAGGRLRIHSDGTAVFRRPNPASGDGERSGVLRKLRVGRVRHRRRAGWDG